MKHSISISTFLLVAIVGLFILTPNNLQAQDALGDASFDKTKMHALMVYFGEPQQDHLLAGTDEGVRVAETAGYMSMDTIGYVFNEQVEGTVPLKLYWRHSREDNLIVVTDEEEKIAQNAGYRFIRIEGYVFAKPRMGTQPLYLFWNTAKTDNHSTTAPDASDYAESIDYQYIRTSAHIFTYDQ